MRLLLGLLLTATLVTLVPAPSYAGPAPTERRTFEIHRAPHRGAHPPLIVALHGAYGSGANFRAVSGWDAVADRAGAVVVYPDAAGTVWQSQEGAEEDVRFLARLIRRMIAREDVDPDRVYVTGHSSGAFMAYRFACERSALVAGIGPVAGAPATDCAREPGPVRVAAVHGTGDEVIPYDGTDLLPSAHETVGRWVAHNGCGPRPRTRQGGAVLTETWRGCDDGAAVRLTSLAGASHSYPAGASRRIWAFLRQR